ncbi:spore protease YyaC [Clostridium sp. FAM 1755]|uniref:spore protease YyaC n=1 Tax=Clostridium TaxID=1485 RepID=UPI0013D20DBB|nr:spore protease YyaC [Clostridium sporogenes]NFV14262.1 spore protease YyaC [Clostridium sporogenes]
MISKTIIDTSIPSNISTLRDILCTELYYAFKSNKEIVIVCIGTDRSTGDSLGPLVGEKLKFLIRGRVNLFGNLENPVHAKNLKETISIINCKYKNPYIIAIDACLGSIQNIGKIIIDSKPIYPGSAVNKDLPAIGDLSISGVVNISGAMEFMVLQNTRLYIVMNLANYISKGIYHSIIKTLGSKKNSYNIENI